MKNSLLKKYKEYGYNEKSGFIQLSFVLTDLSQGQIQNQVITNTNQLLEEVPVVEISAFFMDAKSPCDRPYFATYNVRDSIIYTGNLIATCQHTLLAIKDSFRSKKYFYIQDLSWLEDRFKKLGVTELIKSSEVISFCRSKDHRDHLVSLGYNIHPIIVPDCDIKKILEIVNDKKTGSN